MANPHTRSALPVLGLALWACAGTETSGDARVAVWTLTPEPLVGIGVFEGAPEYELYRASSSLRLADGRIAVANAGTHEIRWYDSAGTFLGSAGGQGGGPGEFRRLGRIFHHPGDAVLALDLAGNRLSVFDRNGTYARLLPPDSADAAAWGAWLYQRFWIDVAPTDSARAAIRRALRNIHVPDTAPSYRYVLPDPLGNLWIREPLAPGATARHWTVLSGTGAPVATVETPRRFEIHDVGPDYVLGRWRDEHDVNHIRLYGLKKTVGTSSAPAWFTAAPGDSAAPPVNDEELLGEVRSALRRVTVAQEMYFAEHRRYSDDRHALRWDPPEGVTLAIVAAEPTGWVAVAAHRDLPRICGMSIGTASIPGWTEGSVHCS